MLKTEERQKLIRQRGCRCENCGLTEWMGKPIKLEVHHLDGNRLNDNSNKFPKAEDNLVVADLMQYESFKKISYELFELLKRKQGNSSLYGYVISLDEELQKMLTIKNKYEISNKNRR